MPWQNIRISRFGGLEVLELVEQPTIPDPGPGEVRIKVLAAGTGFTDSCYERRHALSHDLPALILTGVYGPALCTISRSTIVSSSVNLHNWRSGRKPSSNSLQ